MATKILRLPNGRETSSDRISRVVVHDDRSIFYTHVFIEVFEGGILIFVGYADLTTLEISSPVRQHALDR